MKKRIEARKTMTIEETSKRLGVCYSAAMRAAKAGQLPSIRINKRFLILRELLEKMLNGETRSQ